MAQRCPFRHRRLGGGRVSVRDNWNNGTPDFRGEMKVDAKDMFFLKDLALFGAGFLTDPKKATGKKSFSNHGKVEKHVHNYWSKALFFHWTWMICGRVEREIQKKKHNQVVQSKWPNFIPNIWVGHQQPTISLKGSRGFTFSGPKKVTIQKRDPIYVNHLGLSVMESHPPRGKQALSWMKQLVTCARVDQLPLFPYNRGW